MSCGNNNPGIIVGMDGGGVNDVRWIAGFVVDDNPRLPDGIPPDSFRSVLRLFELARYNRVGDHFEMVSRRDKSLLVEEQANDRFAALMRHFDDIIGLAINLGGAEVKITFWPYLDSIHVYPTPCGFDVWGTVDFMSRDASCGERGAA